MSVRTAIAAALLAAGAIATSATGASCRGDGDGGQQHIGGSCADARDCDTGLCVTVRDAGLCTITCTDDEACPETMTCQRFSLAEEGDAGPIGEAVRACAAPPPGADAGTPDAG